MKVLAKRMISASFPIRRFGVTSRVVLKSEKVQENAFDETCVLSFVSDGLSTGSPEDGRASWRRHGRRCEG